MARTAEMISLEIMIHMLISIMVRFMCKLHDEALYQ